jgi:hypothetical protein
MCQQILTKLSSVKISWRSVQSCAQMDCMRDWESLHPSMNLETLSVSNDDHESCSPNRSTDFIARDRTGCCKGNTLGSYFGRPVFEYRLGHRLFWRTFLRNPFVPSGNSRRTNPFLANSLQFVNHSVIRRCIVSIRLRTSLNTDILLSWYGVGRWMMWLIKRKVI